MNHDGVGCFIGIIIYIYVSVCIYIIAGKTGTESQWFAFVPILNVILLIQIANKPFWWIFLFLIPFVNILIAVLLWIGVSAARGKPPLLGLVMLIPVVNLLFIGYLAFSE